jgi:hypothetical protein
MQLITATEQPTYPIELRVTRCERVCYEIMVRGFVAVTPRTVTA